MKPWTIDAETTVAGKIRKEFLISNKEIEDYLEYEDHDKKLFLVGTKGTGKTLLLKYKADLYFNKNFSSNEQKVSSRSLIENINIPIGGTLDKNTLAHLNSLRTWKNIWRFALCFYILKENKVNFKKYDIDAPKRFFALNISGIISELLSQPQLYLFSDFFAQFNILESITQREIQNQLVFFIDRLDQGLNDILQDKEYKFNEDENGKNIAFQIWKYAQFGLLETIYNLNSSNPHIKIYATARLEALDIISQNKRNVQGLTTTLTYTQDDLKKMFENNIKLTYKKSPSHIKTSKDIFHRFFGFEKMEHPLATNEHNIKRKETVIDFILRHSFERPRDIMEFGKSIYNHIISKRNYDDCSTQDKSEMIRRRVSDIARDVTLKEYFTEFVPEFKVEYLNEFIKSKYINQNVIENSSIKKIEPRIINYLFRSGLIGSIENKHQKFHPAAQSIYDLNIEIPASPYYFTHPTLDAKLRAKLSFDKFYNNHTIVGNGYFFYPPFKNYHDIFTKYSPTNFTPPISAFKSLDKANDSILCKFPIKEVYSFFHKHRDHQKKIIRVKNTFRILSVIAHINSIDKMKNPSPKDLDIREKYHDELLSKKLNAPQYQAMISDLQKDYDLIANRIFGRIITLGCIIHLEMDYEQIDWLFKYSAYPKNTFHKKGSAAASFLSKSFFIDGLGKTFVKTTKKRNKIMDGMSDFEKKELEVWHLFYQRHEEFHDGWS